MDDERGDLHEGSDEWEEMQPVVNCTFQAASVQLFRHCFGPDDNDVCALIGLDPVQVSPGLERRCMKHYATWLINS